MEEDVVLAFSEIPTMNYYRTHQEISFEEAV